jgi:hypothetical protein
MAATHVPSAESERLVRITILVRKRDDISHEEFHK